VSDNPEPGAVVGARPAGRLFRGLELVIAVLLFAMAALTFVDVVGRDAFNAPIPGTFETVGLLLGIVAFAAFPFVTLGERHITVDLFDHFIRGRFRRVRDVVVRLATAAMAGFMAERLWAAALDEWQNDFVTEYFGISRAPLLLLLAILCAGTAVAMLIKTVRRPRDGSPWRAPGQEDEPGEAMARRRKSLTGTESESDEC
jgi:TRAP-type C4-dicarboxylate transport system permease small subunit